MNRDDIIRMAREACGEPAWDGGVEWTWEELERFANLVEAAVLKQKRDEMTNDDVLRLMLEVDPEMSVRIKDHEEGMSGFTDDKPKLLQFWPFKNYAKFANLVAAAERERIKWDSIHSCHPECDKPVCVAMRKAVAAEREACAKVLDEMAAKDKLTNYYVVAALAIRERGAP
jgi:hypothetical protein